MNKKINSIRGMHDHLSKDILIWNKIEKILKEVLNSYCYLEIKLPILEKTEIFQKSIGSVTDIIEKEMYSFQDKKGNSLTLRPEGTVGCVRAIIQNNLLYEKKQKFWYLGPMFRYERPQRGRYRQFHQLGAEVFGLNTIDIDLEIIMLTNRFWHKMGIRSCLTLEINSIGSATDRIKYQKDLINFLKKNEYALDKSSQKRLYTNPFRVLDSKNLNTQKILQEAPLLSKYINVFAKKDFNNLRQMLDWHNVEYKYNKNLVRGLDYYNNLVFEWKSNHIGFQNTICAGGRYDSLVQKLGGNNTSAIGFAVGIERLLLLLKSLNIFSKKIKEIDIYIIFIENDSKYYAIKISEEIRNIYPKLKVFIDFSNFNCSKKIKNALSYSARIAIFIGINEINQKKFLVKDLKHKKEYFFSKDKMLSKIKNIFF